MSTATQRIVTSHKEAAKRASAYLFGIRNLKLKHSEALELVARVLGAANWQTLEAIANRSSSPLAGQGTAASRETDVDALSRQVCGAYALMGWPQHPAYLREDWAKDESDSDESDMGYWKWVTLRMLEDKAMMPWERDVCEALHLARACGVDIDFDFFGCIWVPASYEHDEFESLDPKESELEAWTAAAAAGIAGAKKALGMSDERWNGLTFEAKLSVLKKHYAVPLRTSTQVLVPRKAEPDPLFSRESFVANGFAPLSFKQNGPESYVKVMNAWDMPYVREHIIEMGRSNPNMRTEGVDDNGIATIEVSPDGQVTLSIGDQYKEDPVPVDSDEGRAVLRDAGFPC
jgi:hypothetical protein